MAPDFPGPLSFESTSSLANGRTSICNHYHLCYEVIARLQDLTQNLLGLAENGRLQDLFAPLPEVGRGCILWSSRFGIIETIALGCIHDH